MILNSMMLVASLAIAQNADELDAQSCQKDAKLKASAEYIAGEMDEAQKADPEDSMGATSIDSIVSIGIGNIGSTTMGLPNIDCNAHWIADAINGFSNDLGELPYCGVIVKVKDAAAVKAFANFARFTNTEGHLTFYRSQLNEKTGTSESVAVKSLLCVKVGN